MVGLVGELKQHILQTRCRQCQAQDAAHVAESNASKRKQASAGLSWGVKDVIRTKGTLGPRTKKRKGGIALFIPRPAEFRVIKGAESASRGHTQSSLCRCLKWKR